MRVWEKRLLSTVLAAALVVSGVPPAAVFAADGEDTGLCEHHLTHENCGYVAAVAGAECSHVCDSGCYTVKCVHAHDESCGYAEAVEGVECDHKHDGQCGYAEPAAEIPCSCVPEVRKELIHAADCAYDPAAAESVCTCTPVETVVETVHGEGCGYTPAVHGAECGHVHGECSYVEAKNGTPCGHDCASDEACGEQILSCTHSHDKSCGYVEAVEGKACEFVCEDCAAVNAAADGDIGSGTPDGTPAVLHNLTVSATQVTAPGSITVTVDASDDVSGISNVNVFFKCLETGKSVFCSAFSPDADGKLQGQLTVDQYVESGVFVLDSVTIWDEAGNTVSYSSNSSQNPIPDELKNLSFEVTASELSDGTPAVLHNLTISATQVTAPGSITVTVDASDDVSGISTVNVFFECRETGKSVFCSAFSPDADGKLQGQLRIDQYVESGVFVLDSVTIWDEAGNTVSYSSTSSQNPIPDPLKNLQFAVTNLGADIVTSTSKNTFPEEVENAANDSYIIADFSSNTTLSGDVFTAIAGTDKTIDLVSEGVTWRFEGSDITEEIKDIDLNVQIQKVEEDSSASGDAIAGNLNGNPGVVMKFPENGTLPGKATIQIKVDYAMREYLGSDSGLNVYYYNNQTGELELIAGNLAVVNDTYVEFPITHCSYYVLTAGSPDDTTSGTGGSCGDNAFWEFDADTGTLTISGSGDINDYSGAENLEYAPWEDIKDQVSTLVIGDQITGIGTDAFYGMGMLQEIHIPAGIERISTRALVGCHNLGEITVDGGNDNFASYNGVLFSKDMSVLICCPSGYSGRYTVPDGVTEIADSAFMYCMGVTDIEFPSSLDKIGAKAFFNCHGLTDVVLPDGITEIGTAAFDYCIYLKSINIPASMTVVSTSMLSQTAVENIVLHENIVEIGEHAFWQSALREITVPASVITIGGFAFSQCENLETVTFSEGLETVGIGAFEYCTQLRSASLPDSLKTLGGHAFRNCTSLTEAEIPAGVKTVDYMAFKDCTSLNSVTLHEGLEKITYSAFEKTAIRKITVPETVTLMEWSAFADCKNLEEITFCGDAPTFDAVDPDEEDGNQESVFRNVTATAKYPQTAIWRQEVMRDYGGTITWVPYGDIPCSGTCGDDLVWQFDTDTGTLTITGTGPMYEYDREVNFVPWHPLKKQILSVVMGEGATVISNWAFHDCHNLAEVSLPDTLMEIGGMAFYDCTALKEITFPKNLLSIGGNAFAFCHGLKEVTIPGRETGIAMNAFTMCNNLETVVIESWGFIGDCAFAYNNNLKTVILKDGVMGIGSETFISTPIEEIIIPVSVIEIGSCAFAHCSELKTVTFQGDAPQMNTDGLLFEGVTADAFYPVGNTTWTEAVMQDYGGTITWIPYCQQHSFGEWITEGTNSHRTCIHCGYTEHKVTTGSGDVEIDIPNDPDLEVEVDPVLPSQEDYILVEEALDNSGNQNQVILKVFEINLKNADGVHVQPSGTVKVKLPLDWSQKGNYKVYRVNDDGTLTDMNAYRQGSHMVFETDHFSLYVIVEDGHRHSYDKGAVTAKPTCMAEGVKTFTCSVCGAAKTARVEKDPDNHSFTRYKSDNNATCKKNGTKTAKCDYGCGETDTVTDKGSKLGHAYEDGKCIRCGISQWTPDTGDQILLAAATLIVSGAALLLLFIRKKKKR